MKWKGLVVAVSVLALSAMGCGGDSTGGGGGGTTTPTATSSKTLLALSNATGWMYGTSSLIVGAVQGGGGASIKAETTSISCTGTLDGFSCVIWDSQGSATSTDHKCDVTGSATMDTLYTFNLAYDCYGFKPSETGTVDGNWDAEITINPDAMPTASVNMSADGGFEKAETDGECSVEDIADACGQTFSCDGGTCTVECGGTATCSEAQALAILVWTVGSRGVVVTDECGTYNLATGSTTDTTMCVPTQTSFNMTFVIDATINGEAVNDTINVNCQNIAL